MRRFVWLLGLVAVAACQDKSPTGVTNPPADTGQTSGNKSPQFIVVLQPKTDARTVAKDHGITPTYTYTAAISGFAGKVSDAAKAGLLKDSRVVSVEKDQDFYAEGVQPALSWGLDRVDQHKGMDGFYTWSLTGKGVTAYIIDTGILYSHQDFGGRASFGFDAFGGDGSDCQGHGTHVAGITGGAKYGVAKDVDLVSVRVLNCNGGGSTATVLAGLDWVLANARRPAVANMSLGGLPDSAVDAAVRNLALAGITIVVAAGNNNFYACLYSPARVAEAITVGATTSSDDRASYSNYGDCVDWFAPGSSIVSEGIKNDTATRVLSGTSMAAPHTTGAAALYLQQNPTATPEQVTTALASWTTKHVVGSANTRNNDLLYTLGDATSGGSGGGNAAPTAAFTVTCSGLTCSFTDASSDSDGTIASWSWDFGDGSVSAEQSPTHTYAVDGSYAVNLTVTDNGGAIGTRTQTISVAGGSPTNTAPNPDFTVSCARLICDFTDASTDSDGQIVRVEWNFGDGATAVLSTASATESHTFSAGGSYSVSLKVTDDAGAAQSLTRAVSVGLAITATGYRKKGTHTIDVTWQGAESSKVDIYVDDTKAATVATSPSSYTYSNSNRGQATYQVKVCEAGTTYCSRTETVSF